MQLMLKEAGLFVVSAGLLVYLVSPSEEEPKPVVAEATKKANTTPTQEADDWDDEEDEDEDFVFGEPLVYSEDSESEAEDESVEELGAVPVVSPRPIQSVSRRTYRKAPVFKKSPAPGELGSRENPVVMSPSVSRR